MLTWAFMFLMVALLAGAFGALGVQFIAADMAWLLFAVFLTLFIVSLIVGRRGGPSLRL